MTSEETKYTHSNEKLSGGREEGFLNIIIIMSIIMVCVCTCGLSLSPSTLRMTTDMVTEQIVVNSDLRNVGNT